jgi:hypothetical protein
MGQLARRSQRTVQHCGNGIRMTAASTMPNQIPHRPLQAYMDETSIAKHVQPWQQILLFIIHMQKEWPWRQKKPQYVMTARQQQTWQRLWQLACRSDETDGGVSPASHGSPDPMSDRDQLELDQDQLEAFVMTLLETACLDFCIKLLNQKTRVHEYESLLVCVMAVLGRGEQGWRDANSYPPILLRVLKVARFLVVQKALWLDPQHWAIIQMWAAAAEQGSWMGEAADQELAWLFEDEGYAEASPPSSPSSQETASTSHSHAIGCI